MDQKKYIPHLVAVLLFIIISALFFKPVVFDKKQIRQGDVTNFLGASKEISDYRETNKKEALWTNSMFGGMPAYQISIQYPNNLIQYFQKITLKIFPTPVAMIFLCMIGFYFLLITMKVNPWASIAGGIAFGLSSFFVIVLGAGHNTEGFAIAYMAPVVMGVFITMRGKLWLGGSLTALALAIELNANHLQITYYLLITVLFVGLGEAFRLASKGESRYLAKATGFLIAAAFLAVLPNYSNLALTNEYGKESTRGKSEITIDSKDQKKTNGLPIDYATQWSYGKGETFSLMIPNINGGASEAIKDYDKDALKSVDDQYKESIGQQGAYFGDQPFTSGPVYVGAIICFLFVLALFIVKDQIKWWLLAATVLSIMLSWGKNLEGFTEFFFNWIPGYNKFRSVSMILVIAELTMPLLGMLAIKEIIKRPGEVRAKMKFIYIAFALTGGICFLVYIMPTSFVTPVSDVESKQINDAVLKQGGTANIASDIIMNLENARTSIVQSDALRSFFLIFAAGLLIIVSLFKKYNPVVISAGLAVLMLFDMWGVSHRFMSERNYEKKTASADQFSPSPADELIWKMNKGKKDTLDYRVLNLDNTWQDAATSYYHKSIGGYHGAKLKRIQELYENVMENNVNMVRSTLQMQPNDSVLNDALARQGSLNMLNTKYIIFNPEGGVIENTNACGNAWFVKDVKMVESADAEITSIKSFSPKTTAFVDKVFAKDIDSFKPKYDSSAKIEMTFYSPNDLKYTSSASSDQFAVFSEIYYAQGWDAYIDGKLTPHVRADFVLRAMKIPAGQHQVEFKFEPKAYYSGEKIALAGSILLILFFGVGIYKSKQGENEINPEITGEQEGDEEETEEVKDEKPAKKEKGEEKISTKGK